VKFVKYHGLGNDFVIVDRRQDSGDALSEDLVQNLCDRHRGIGADGVLTLWPDQNATARIQVQNADGGESGMCGNGLRCVTAFAWDTQIISDVAIFAMGGGTYRCEKTAVHMYKVGMGCAEFSHPDLPDSDDGRVELSAAGNDLVGYVAWYGNPHWVSFDAPDPKALAERHGPILSTDAVFPHGVNVSFVRSDEDAFEAVVYERGVGITQACGSGACAIVANAVRTGRAQAGQPVFVHLPGGGLRITVEADGSTTMEGTAVRVYAGEIGI